MIIKVKKLHEKTIKSTIEKFSKWYYSSRVHLTKQHFRLYKIYITKTFL